MSRVNPLFNHRLLYLGDVAEPPDWLPPNIHNSTASIFNSSRIGMFILSAPSEEEIRELESLAGKAGGVVSPLKTSGADFCIYIGPRSALGETVSDAEPTASLAAGDFHTTMERFLCASFTLTLRSGRPFTLGERTKVMGILNVTPDSFSDGGRFHNLDAAVAQAEKMVEEGADIIDVGGESTRPGADPVSLEEEADRVLPVIEYISKHLSVPASIDTCKAEIARRALDTGAELVNDISALRFDEEMVEVVRHYRCPLILMHMLGTPKVMQQDPFYDALMPEIISFLAERMDFAVRKGIQLEQLIVDPGIGFGKTVEHNLAILLQLKQLRALGRPLLIGPSRKSTIGKVLDAEVYDRIEGTAAAVAVSVANGAHIVRVHDVKEMIRVAKMTDAIMGRRWN